MYKQFTDIETALFIYYNYPELGNSEIKKLFGEKIGNSTISRYKNDVRKVQTERGIVTAHPRRVNTEIAYEVWGINVKSLERRREKIRHLGLSA